MSPYFLWIFFSLNTGRTLPRFPNKFSKHRGFSFYPWEKMSMVLLQYFPIKISPFRWLSCPLNIQYSTSTYHNCSPVFITSGTFHHYKSYRRNHRGQCQRVYWGHEHLQLHQRHATNPCTPQKTTSYIHYTNHSTRSQFQHTTQLETKATPKLRI